jgi:Type IV secretion system pilin
VKCPPGPGGTAGRPRPPTYRRTLDARRRPTRPRNREDIAQPKHLRPVTRLVPWIAVLVIVAVVGAASPAAAATPTLTTVISNLTNWIVGILAGVATLFLTIGGLRYLTAGGDPGQVEKAKTALKSAAIGYALAILAPLIVSIVTSVIS